MKGKNAADGTFVRVEPPSKLIVWGEIRGKDSELCIDSMASKSGWVFGKVETRVCFKEDADQTFRIHANGRLAQQNKCVYPKSVMIDQLSIDTGNLNVYISESDKKDLVLRQCQSSTSSLDSWVYEKKTKNLKFKEKCVSRVSQTEGMTISLEDCQPGKIRQQWEVKEWEGVN